MAADIYVIEYRDRATGRVLFVDSSLLERGVKGVEAVCARLGAFYPGPCAARVVAWEFNHANNPVVRDRFVLKFN